MSSARVPVDLRTGVRAAARLRILNDHQRSARHAFIDEAMRNAAELDSARSEIRRLRRRLEEVRRDAGLVEVELLEHDPDAPCAAAREGQVAHG